MKSTTNATVIFFYQYDYFKLNLHDADADEHHVEKQNANIDDEPHADTAKGGKDDEGCGPNAHFFLSITYLWTVY